MKSPRYLLTTSARVAIGLLFLMTAGLKAYGLFVDPLESELHGIRSSVQLIAVEIELLLGMCLVSGYGRRWSLRFAVTFFVIAAAVAARQVWDRQTSCACFGRFEVNPAFTLALDLLVLLILTVLLRALPRGSQDYPRREGRGDLILGVAVPVITTVLLVTASGLLGVVDYHKWILRLRGDLLEISPRVSDLGTHVRDQKVTTQIEVWNHGAKNVRIQGGQASCGCVAYDGLPAVIPPGGSVKLPISVKMRGGYGSFRARYVLFTNLPEQPELDGGLVGKLVLNPSDCR